MALGEFDLINSLLKNRGRERKDVLLGIGDDAALLQPPSGRTLVATTDTLVSGIHFFPDTDYRKLGWKTLAVSLSDLAAMAAQPAWALLSITLPQPDEHLLGAFSEGLGELAELWDVALVGGDTTRGPLSFSLTLLGWVDPDQTLRRDQAKAGDRILVTGRLGDAALALRLISQGKPCPPELLEQLNAPVPRLDEAGRMARHARCGLDISDGLLADLGHICEASGVGAYLELGRLPMSRAVLEQVQEHHDWSLPLATGDDYELCITLPPAAAEALRRGWPEELAPLSIIGEVRAAAGIECRLPDGRRMITDIAGHDHFS